MTKRVHVGIFYALALMGTTGMALAQSQTNVNVYGEGGTSAPPAPVTDTVIETETRVEGETTIKEETTLQPDVAVQDQAVDTVGDIEPSDVKRLERRREAKRFSMAGFGPATFRHFVLDDDDNRMSYDIYLGRAWEVTSRSAIKSKVELTSDLDDNHMADLALGANFYALPTDFSPYIGGDLGLGMARGNNENSFGFTAGAAIGALLFRTADTQMNIEGGADVMFSQLADEFPTKYTATIGVLF